jgi:FecR protein
MATVARAKTPARGRRGGRRLLVILGIVVLLIAGGVIWLNVAAQAQVNAFGTLTVYQPEVSTSRSGGAITAGKTGAVIRAGDTVTTDPHGLGAISLPDGSVTRLATNTAITLDSAHFTRNGNLHDVSFTQTLGRTFTNLQHLVAGSTFDVHGKSATASVRGTKFEVFIDSTGAMIVKVFQGTVILHNGTTSVTINAGQQATANPNGTITPPGPIQPDPNDPFGPQLDASNAAEAGTTPGTEQDFQGAVIHNGQSEQFTYSYAGGNLIKASLGYPGSLMKLSVKGPDGAQQSQSGKSPVVITINSAPAGIYTITVTGLSGLGNPGDANSGEAPFVAVASVESCVSAVPGTEQNGAVHRGYTAQDLINAVQQSGQGLSNVQLSLADNSNAGAIINAKGTYNGFGWSGSVVLVAHDGVLDIMPTSGTVFGLNVPAQQVVQQVAAAIGQDPSNLNPGFYVDRLFTCDGVMMVDGRLPTS